MSTLRYRLRVNRHNHARVNSPIHFNSTQPPNALANLQYGTIRGYSTQPIGRPPNQDTNCHDHSIPKNWMSARFDDPYVRSVNAEMRPTTLWATTVAAVATGSPR